MQIKGNEVITNAASSLDDKAHGNLLGSKKSSIDVSAFLEKI
jgi:hypothetical protein